MAWSIVYRDYVAAGGSSFSWGGTGADSYDVGYSSTSQLPGGDVNNAALYDDIVNVGTNLSWTNNTGSAVYASVRSVDTLGEVGPWATPDVLLSA